MDTQHDFGPIQQLRCATERPLALGLGCVLGAFVPVSTYVTAHVGGLLNVHDGTVTRAPLEHPGWALVFGGLAFSATTVYRWGALAFRPSAGRLTLVGKLYTHCKALGFVSLIELTLLLSPSPALSAVALGLLVVINAIATGSALSLRDLADRAVVQGRAEVVPRVETAAEPAVPPSPAPMPETTPALAALPAPALPVSTLGDPGAAPEFSRLYGEAREFVQGLTAVSAKALRERFGVPHREAASLLAELEANGVIAATKNNLGQRPVLLAG